MTDYAGILELVCAKLIRLSAEFLAPADRAQLPEPSRHATRERRAVMLTGRRQQLNFFTHKEIMDALAAGLEEAEKRGVAVGISVADEGGNLVGSIVMTDARDAWL